jgi:hypothetical protein
MPKLTIKIGEIKPSPNWDANKARDCLIKMGATLQRKCAAQNPPVDIKAVKCKDLPGGDLIEYEWSGAAAANDVKRVIKL